jgi:hypothetical protein
MIAELDLNFLPFHRIAGKDRPSLPGLMTSAPPRRAARGRERDQLFIYLALAGNTPITSDEYTKLVAQMTGRFYETAGSLTAALRVTADLLNQSLLNRNLGTTGKGQYIVGRLVLGVLRGRQLVLVQSGPTHFFRIGKDEVEHIHDPELSGRGLGFNQATPLYYFQLDIYPGDHLVMCAQLPEGWESALLSERGITSLEALRRKLQVIPNENINAALIQVQAGKGTLNLMSTVQNEAPVDVNPVPMLESEPVIDMDLNMDELRSQEEQSRQQSLTSVPGPITRAAAEMERSPGLDSPSQPDAPRPGQISQPASPPPITSRSVGTSQLFNSSSNQEIPEIERPSARRSEIIRFLLTGLQRIRKFGRSVVNGFQTLLKRTLPGMPEDRTPALQGSTMAFIAVVIPLTVVVIASSIYMRFGRSAQYDENYKLAINAAIGAIGQTDTTIVRGAWESTIDYLDKADQYQITQDSDALRQQAQSALDAMDQIIRLDFRLAINGGLSKTVQIRRMAANETDLYMLNEAQGNVMRAFMTGQGYEVDPKFVCGPGSYPSKNVDSKETFVVGNILDIVALPRVNPFGATVMGMDGKGTLIFCNSDIEPLAWKLEEPGILWKGPAGFALGAEDNALYVLDPAGNAVWVYTYDVASKLFGQPVLFFSDNYVPKNLPQVKDIAVAGMDLYLLFEDGHVTNCVPGQEVPGQGVVVPTRCNDPETMLDTREAGKSGPALADILFSSMTFTSPPDPSLYMLEPATPAIFRFSPRPEALYMQNQFRATVDQERTLSTSPVSAMAISNSPNRYIFLCVGNQIYYATDVP